MVPEPIDEFGPERYGDSFADVYDEWYDDVSDAQATAQFLDRFGAGQRVLELGVGTGRLSGATAAYGHHVVGLDVSKAMLDRFRPTAGSRAVRADMRILPFAGSAFDTVLVATNTLFNLHGEGMQAQCFAECRRVLRLGGRLIVEAMIPGQPDPSLDRLVTTRSIGIDSAVLTATIRDPLEQEIVGQHIQISENGNRLRPRKIRYATPTQLDAMAADAGFHRGARYADWDQTQITESSASAVSVYVAS
jgi:SAM-dependent methyltransferase